MAAIAVFIVTAATAFAIDRSPETCAQTAVCVIRLGGSGGCLPGPCDVARHRAALRASEAIAFGGLLGGVLLLARHPTLQSPGRTKL
jgi:hypothetical protein